MYTFTPFLYLRQNEMMDLSALTNKETLDAVKRQFATSNDCDNYLHKIRWANEISSPFDAHSKVYKCQGNRYRCKNTKKYFNIRTNTLFHNSKVPLPIWFEAIWIIAHSNKITSVALAAKLNLTQKTAWFMLRRIKRFLSDNDLRPISKESPDLAKIHIEETSTNAERLNLTEWLNLLKNKQ